MIPCHTLVKMSMSDAARRGVMSCSAAIRRTMGPAITMATVLLAVDTSTSDEIAAMLNCAPRLLRAEARVEQPSLQAARLLGSHVAALLLQQGAH